MRDDFIEVYDDLNDARHRQNELDKKYNDKNLEVVIQPFDGEDGKKKYGLFVDKNDLEYAGFLFGPDDVYYEKCKDLVKLLKKNVPSLEWEKEDSKMKTFEEIWQFGSVPIRAYIAKVNENYLLRIADFGVEFNIGKLPKRWKKPYEILLNKKCEDSKIFLKGGKLKKKRENKVVCFEYEYQIEYWYGYKK